MHGSQTQADSPRQQTPGAPASLSARSLFPEPPAGMPALPGLSRVFEDLSRGVVTAGAHHAAAGMGGGATKIEPFDRGAIIGVTRQGPHEGEAGERHDALHNVA